MNALVAEALSRADVKTRFETFKCIDGPWKGRTIELDRHAQGHTLPLTIGGIRGRYVRGVWKPEGNK